MGRKDFIADVQGASELAIPGISLVARGDDDGEVNVCFVPPSGAPIELSMLAQPGTSPDLHYVYPSYSVFPSASAPSIPRLFSWYPGAPKYSLP
jgi:ubiquitin-conjugating enzyme E2 Q